MSVNPVLKMQDQQQTHQRHLFRNAIAWSVLFALALGLRVGFAILWPNLFHPDEIFQTLEPAHRLVFGYGAVTWEWRTGIRSLVFPGFLAAVMRVSSWFATGPSAYLDTIVVVLSLISLSAVWFGYSWAKRVSGQAAAILAAAACSFYFGLIYFAPKALNEVIAAHVLLPGLYVGRYAERMREKKRMLLAGVLCGFAASLRIQLIPAVAFAAIYFCLPRWRQRAAAMLAGLLLPVLAFGVVDWVTWSHPFQSFFRYFQANLLEGRSLDFGVEPWYWYLLVILALLGPMVFFLWQGARRTPLLAIFCTIVFVSHSALSHKELRFLYPILPLMLVMCSIGLSETTSSVANRVKWLATQQNATAAGLLFLIISSMICSFPLAFKWRKQPGGIYAADRLYHDASLCGLGIFQMKWWATGGYTHLHRDVPIVPIEDASEFLSASKAFNALVAPDNAKVVPATFRVVECKNGICLYQRPGTCAAPQTDQPVNAYLRKTGR